MKLRFLVSTAAVCAGLLGSAFANQVLLLNGDSTGKSIEVSYRVAHKDPGSSTQLGSLKTVNLQHGALLGFPMEQHHLVGIVVESVNGHQLPAAANRFAKPRQCSVATTKLQSRGVAIITLKHTSQHHGKVLCQVVQTAV